MPTVKELSEKIDEMEARLIEAGFSLDQSKTGIRDGKVHFSVKGDQVVGKQAIHEL